MKYLIAFTITVLSIISYLNITETRKESLVYFADLHGHFEEHPELFWSDKDSSKTQLEVAGGVARIKHVLDRLKQDDISGR